VALGRRSGPSAGSTGLGQTELMEFTVEPDPARFLDQIAAVPGGVPVTMLNLLRFRERASYDDAGDAGLEPCSGREAYEQRYGACAFEHVTRVGGEVLWGGEAAGSLIAPEGEEWDTALLVRYPSIEAFTEMIGDPDYTACSRHRRAALADSRLIATVDADAGPTR
jgi:uncharacterized protein (DUF1330 family)